MSRKLPTVLLTVLLCGVGATPGSAAVPDPPKGAPIGVIEGVVLDDDRAPVPGLEVVLSGPGLTAPRRVVTTAPTGAFRFEGVPAPGSFTLTTATDDGAGHAMAPVTLGDRPLARVELRLKLSFSETVTVTGTREGELKGETPATIGTVTRSDLQAMRPSHASEVLGHVPGVWVSTTGGEGHMTSIRQPLTTSPVYLYLEDGVPTRSTGFFNHNALYEVNLPDAEGIEVTKGPGSALYGSDAIGGVINVITRSALGSAGLSGQLEGGGFGWRRLQASAGLSSASDGLRASMNLTRSDGWRDATGYDRQSGSMRWDSTRENSAWKALVSYTHINQQTAGSSTLQLDDYLSNPGRNLTPISFRKVKAFRASLDYERAFGAALLSLVPYTRYDTMDLLANWSLTYDPTVYTSSNSSFGVLAKLRIDVPRWRTQVLAGVDLDVSPGGHVENQISVQTTKTPNGKTLYSSYTLGDLVYDYDVTFVGLAPYAQVEFSPASRIRVDAGVRFDTNRFAYQDKLTTPQTARYLRPASTTRTYREASPKLGVTYQVSRRVNVFASYRHAFRSPAEGQLFRQGSTHDTVDLRPVHADNVEIGLRATPARQLSVEVSAYRLDKRDDILSFRNPADGYTDVLNAGRTRHQGVEAALGFTPASWVSLSLAYSHATHFYRSWVVDPARAIDYSGKEMETAPRDLVNGSLTLRPLPGVSASAEIVGVGSYWMDAANSYKYGGHTLMNLRGQFTIRNGIQLFARVMNAANRRFAESSAYTLARGPEFAPGRPRTLLVGLEIDWTRK